MGKWEAHAARKKVLLISWRIFAPRTQRGCSLAREQSKPEIRASFISHRVALVSRRDLCRIIIEEQADGRFNSGGAHRVSSMLIFRQSYGIRRAVLLCASTVPRWSNTGKRWRQLVFFAVT